MGREFVKFIIVGGISTAFHYAILIVLVEIFKTGVVIASTLGFSASAILNYILNYRFTFRASVLHISSFPKFLVTAAAGLALNATILQLAVGLFAIHYVFGQIIATGTTLVWNFVINKIWSFIISFHPWTHLSPSVSI